jgi:alpha-L-glutamate ligase-like protein
MLEFLKSPYLHSPFKKLKAQGVLGMNARSIDYIFPLNPREKFAAVDNKVITKKFMHENGIPTTETYGIITRQSEIPDLLKMVKGKKSFVIKPAQGSGGDGISIIAEHDGVKNFTTPSGAVLPIEEINYRLGNILTGLHSKNGRSDDAIIEYKIEQNQEIQKISYKGIADIRIIVCQGKVAMAMLRLPTKASDGKANLHQGGIGVGINVETGVTESGSLRRKFIEKHPDNEENIIGFKVPFWQDCLEIAVKFQQLCGLGYVGVDIAMDEKFGPLVLEGNARPGLEIQLANRKGLIKTLPKSENL